MDQAENQKRKPETAPTAADALLNASVGFLTTPTQDNAIQLFELGLNVFPVPFAQKGGWPWKQLQYIRIHPKHLLAAFEGRCNLAVMTGRTSGNLFVIDCETREAFTQQGEMLRQAGIPLWSALSGGAASGGHYYLRCADGEVSNIRGGELGSVEVRGNRCYVLAPPSVHPDTGVIYQWGERESDEPPTVHIQDIAWLPLKLTTRAKKAAGRAPAPFAELSSQTRDFILNGAPPGERNNRLFAAACDMAGNNYDQHAARQILTPIALASGLPASEVRDTLRSAFSQPREPARKEQPPSQPQYWERAAAWAQTQHWSGRTGQTDRAVFLACCERARLGSNENGIFRASTREVAELARVTRKTASASLRRLQKAHFILFRGHDTVSGASLWKLGPETVRNYPTTPTWLSSSGVISLSGQSDAVERGALGKTGMLVYACLIDYANPIMPTALGERLHLSRHQVQRALRKLSDYGLVRREAAGWVAMPVDNEWLDANVAAVAGTLGKADVRKARHAEERAYRAGREILLARRALSPSAPAVLRSVAGREFHGVLYCQNCGQSIFVFEGTLPPRVCDFCAHTYGWVKGTIWLSEPPSPPPHEDRRKK